MWREPAYTELKNDNREKLLVKKQEPRNYIDILSVIEHPKFIEYYELCIRIFEYSNRIKQYYCTGTVLYSTVVS